MSKIKKSFIVHLDSLDVLDELNNDQAGQLLKAMRDYNKGAEVNLPGLLKAVFIPFKNQFDRDAEKYEGIVLRNKENGKNGGRPKETQQNPVGSSGGQPNPNKPDNDNDSVSDSKKDSDKTPPLSPAGGKVQDRIDFMGLDEEVKIWLEYKKSRRQSYKNDGSIQALVKKLFNESGGNKERAMEIIEHSMANNYSGIFAPKPATAQPPKEDKVAAIAAEKARQERMARYDPSRPPRQQVPLEVWEKLPPLEKGYKWEYMDRIYKMEDFGNENKYQNAVMSHGEVTITGRYRIVPYGE